MGILTLGKIKIENKLFINKDACSTPWIIADYSDGTIWRSSY
jgi:hypothetical protein